MRTWTLASALLLAIYSHPGLAQSTADHQAHHPDQTETTGAKPAAPPEMPRDAARPQGMGSGTANMMGGDMSMPDMMRMMGRMRQSGGEAIGGMERTDHIEG